jgi:uncharacterized protein (TIGR02231 family)
MKNINAGSGLVQKPYWHWRELIRRKAMVRPLLLAFFCMILTGWVQAKTISTSTIISAVTVYPGQAGVTRSGTVQVEPGEHTLVIDALPADVHPGSLRIRGRGTAKVQIGSVQSKTIYSEELTQAEEQRLQQQITKLEDEKSLLEKEVEALRMQLSFIQSIGKNMPETINEEIKAGKIDPQTWRKAWENIGDGAAQTYKNILEKQRASREVNVKLTRLHKQLGQIRTGRKATTQAQVSIAVQNSGSFEFLLSYQMNNASWQPVYDARLNVESGELRLLQYGLVRQRTGESWDGVQLTLSTANPAVGAQLPDLEPWFVNIARPAPMRREEAPSRMFGAKPEAEADITAKAPAPSEAEPRMAQARASEFAAEFQIAGKVQIPADNAPHKFAISNHTLNVELAARVVPKLNTKAFLYADTTYEGQTPLLPGRVALFRDNAYIGNAQLELIRPSEEIKLSFGVDDRVGVQYRLVSDKSSQSGIIQQDNVVERRFRTEITNHHQRPMKITVVDHIPVPQDERIEVELLDTTTQPTRKNPDERLGLLEWTQTYKPNETKTISSGFRLRYPKDLQVPGF